MRRLRDKLIFFAAAIGVVVPAAALGLALSTTLTSTGVALASPQDVIHDCARDGKLDQQYSLSDLKKAEKNLPTDVDEYTNCRDVINQAEVASSGNKGSKAHGASGGAGGGSGKSGGGGGPSAKDVKALNSATQQEQGAPSLSLQGEKVTPGSGGVFKTAGAANSIPLPVLLSLIAVAALTAAGGFVALKRRFPEVIGAALRVFRR
jgi:hypothetical protein